MSEYEKNLDNFILNLRKGNFYDAHEDLESIWFPRRFEESDEVKLLKGFINASVSFELRKKGKIEQAKKVWNNYLKYRNLINKIDSLYIEKYHLIIKEIDKRNI
ncbi:DUF309 domain-containing protein [Sulfurimonas sp.]|uniref:DUF309 domain-containing protein n=1 Tax=Sulfurimonas sp. TaxID=2022749 RepID=UPI00286DEAD2|nr:DUF309 domain-containing protein [Sulfurimonas sp.]